MPRSNFLPFRCMYRRPLESVATLSVWSCAVRGRAAAPGAACPVGSIRCEASSVDTFWRFVGVRTTDCAAYHFFVFDHAVRAVEPLRVIERVDDHGELALQDVDSLLDDRVWLEIPDALDIQVEVAGLCVVVKRLVWRYGSFPLSVFRDRPVEFNPLVSGQKTGIFLVCFAIAHHSLTGSSSYQ